jgi:hypothetical protein
MPTIEELERRADEIAEAEVEACREIRDALRDAAVKLPEGSTLKIATATAEAWHSCAKYAPNDPELRGL